jgi:hypothetical protein
MVLLGACLQSGSKYSPGEGSPRPDAMSAALPWGPATRIDDDTTFVASAAEMAMDGDGNILAVWLAGDAGGLANRVCASRFTTSGWQAPTVLNPDAGNDMPAYQPRIAADGGGNFFAVWSQAWKTEDQPRIGVFAKRWASDSGWEATTTIFADKGDAGSNATGALDLAADASGNATAVWGANDDTWSHFTLRAAGYTPGAGWAPSQVVSREGVQSATPPAVAMDGAGNAMVMWGQAAGDSLAAKGLQAARYSLDTGWNLPVTVEPSSIAETRSSAVARVGFDPKGDTIAVWSHSAMSGVYANRWSLAAGWGEATAIADTRGTESDEGVRLVLDRQGQALVLWTHQGGGVLVRRQVGGVWEAAEVMGPGDSGDIAVHPEGSAVAVWVGRTSDGSQIMTRAFRPGAGWGAVSAMGSNASEPRIVVDRAGAVTLLWRQAQGLFAARSMRAL